MHKDNCRCHGPELQDYGREPIIFNIDQATKNNRNFRTALWTGCHMQMTVMSIPVGCDIGLEFHENVDQFIRIEKGCAEVIMGNCQHTLDRGKCVDENYAIIVPAGTWHNIINVGNCPLKLYSIYSPPNHQFGTVHKTKADAEHSDHYHA